MNWLSDYIFDPVEFYVRLQKQRTSWLLALSGLLLCIILHIADFLILSNKIVTNLNHSIIKVNTAYILEPLSSYGISIFGSITSGLFG